MAIYSASIVVEIIDIYRTKKNMELCLKLKEKCKDLMMCDKP